MRIEIPKLKEMYVDIETSPNLGAFFAIGSKQNINHTQILQEREILTIAYKWKGKKKVYGKMWDFTGKPGERDRKLLQWFSKAFLEADVIRTQNGIQFDEKWIRARLIILDLPPLPQIKHVDMLRRHKRWFKFNCNKQDYLSDLFGFGGKLDTDWSLWIDMWWHLDRKAGQRMLDYNIKDVLDMEAIDEKTERHEPKKINAYRIEMYEGHCIECGGELIKNGTYRTEVRQAQRWICSEQDCRQVYTQTDKQRKW